MLFLARSSLLIFLNFILCHQLFLCPFYAIQIFPFLFSVYTLFGASDSVCVSQRSSGRLHPFSEGSTRGLYSFYGCICSMHRIGRVLSFFSSRPNWASPNPSPAGEFAPPPPPVLGGGAHSLAREGWRESPNYDEGTYIVVLFIFTYFVAARIYRGYITCISCIPTACK
jgi:hypothetical protein